MKRRQFIQSGSLMTLPIFLGGLEVNAIAKSSLFNLVNNTDDRILVIIQLNGGNDGLNMVIPMDQYQGLTSVRPDLLIPETKVLKLTDLTGVNPNMTGIQRLYNEGKIGVVQSVGYPNQNRSHFRSTDIWTSASAADEYLSTGWLGRYLDLKYPGYPTDYPNEEYPDPFAITLGAVVSETCQGSISNFSFTLTGQDSILTVEETEAPQATETCYYKNIDFVKTTISQSNAYAARVLEAFDKGNNISSYGADNRLAQQLKIVANLISGGLQTKIYVTSLGGFDTHANQVQIGDSTLGNHANLLKTVSDAIASFMDDCQALGINERVVGMTFSEFGRQIAANNSFGTDHGTAAPLFVFGTCINPQVLGNNPSIPQQVTPQEGVAMQYDFRSVYATLLVDWLGAKDSDIKTVLFDDFAKLPLIQGCIPDDVTEVDKGSEIQVFPNPCTSETTLRFTLDAKAHIHIAVYDVLGSMIRLITDKSLDGGDHSIKIDTMSLVSGAYHIRMQQNHMVQTLRFIKV
ncbi:MAG: DUF1501 domain-containing protein [Lewinellaceae bacterium]|nr:DUF1501 domain-containing protein [Lewinellaceae bacterium]